MTDSFPATVLRRAHERPDAVFVEDVWGRTLSYAETVELAVEWGGALRELGLDAGDTVLTMLPACVEGVAIWLGAAYAGVIDVGVNPELKGELLRDLFADSSARVLVTTSAQLRFAASALERTEITDVIVLDATSEVAAAAGVAVRPAAEVLSAARRVPSARPELWDIACVIYTSGTTGPSKGVLVPWGQLAANCEASIDLYGADDAYYSPFPMNHASGRMPYVFMAMSGGRVVIREKFSATRFWEDIAASCSTVSQMPGTIAPLLMSLPPSEHDQDNGLRVITMIPLVDDLDAFRARFDVEVRTMFNQTELSTPITSDGTLLIDHRSCGRLRAGYEARLVDQHDQQVPVGTVGELIVRADRPWTLMAGYLGKPEATAAAWRNGWLHTGDLFTTNEAGDYYYVDRSKDAIRRRGENISSVELERLAEAHPAIAEAAAVGVAAAFGEEEVLLVAVRSARATITPAELVEHLAEVAPRHMVPRYVDFVDALPRTANATRRVQKQTLRDRGLSDSAWDSTLTGVLEGD